MIEHVGRQLNFLVNVCSRERLIGTLYGCAAALTLAIGVLGLNRQSPARHWVETCINIHALFGALLYGLIIAGYLRRLRRSSAMRAADAADLSRQLARLVYLIVYLAIAIRQGMSIIGCLLQGGAMDFNLFDERLRGHFDRMGIDPGDDLQLLVLTSISAIVLVKVLGYRMRLRCGTARSTKPRDRPAR
jgi:hypothetical protein